MPTPSLEGTRLGQGSDLITRVLLRVDEEGHVTDVVVVRSFDTAHDFNTIKVFGEWRFEPAKYNDEPVPVVINVELNEKIA